MFPIIDLVGKCCNSTPVSVGRRGEPEEPQCNVSCCNVLVECHILTGVVGGVIVGVQVQCAGGLQGGNLNMVKGIPVSIK